MTRSNRQHAKESHVNRQKTETTTQFRNTKEKILFEHLLANIQPRSFGRIFARVAILVLR